MSGHFINGEWQTSRGTAFSSSNPATGSVIWKGNAATQLEVNQAVSAAKIALQTWSSLPIEKRIEYVEAFQEILTSRKEKLATAISEETGKPLWDALSEVNAMIGKVAISKEAYFERCPDRNPMEGVMTRHKPIGVLAIFGPFNFPGHLPNGHIVPALIAGNTVVLKPSELTPRVTEIMVHYWEKSGLPKGVINLIQGDADTGRLLSNHENIDGLLFTGSYSTGQLLSQQFAKHPEKILALEMGGNNPYVIGTLNDKKAAAYLTLQSAYLSSGQRCTCARRLILPSGPDGEQFLKILIPMIENISVGAYTESPEPFMGPVIHLAAAEKLLQKQEEMIEMGAHPLVKMHSLRENTPFLAPGLIDVTTMPFREDLELFGPLLQLIRVKNFDAAIEEANQTKYGLAAGLLSDDKNEYEKFYKNVHAGVINWNTPLTGASSRSPFGGIGRSGNHRPSAFYAADYCSYPVASMESPDLKLPSNLSPGVTL